MRIAIVFLGLAMILAHAVPSAAEAARTVLDVWPGRIPGEVGSVGEEKAKTATQPDGTTVTTSLTNVAETSIDSLNLKVDQAFGYWFDFGDDWWHQINVLAIDGKVGRAKYPKVIKRVGKSPPQYGDEEE